MTVAPVTDSVRPTGAWDSLLADELVAWGVPNPALAVVDSSGVVAAAGPLDAPRRWASVTKILAALAVLSVVRDGLLTLIEPAGPPGSTVRHLLGHASGWAFDEQRVLADPGTRRIYSNVGIDAVTELARDRAGAPDVARLLTDRVLAPLGMTRTEIVGPAAHGAIGPVSDLALLAHELLAPRVLPAGVVDAAATLSFPGLAGVLPGFGRHDPNEWGLGFEVRGRKSPHWTPDTLSADAFGHFGQAGAFVWVDRTHGLAVCAATDVDFGTWAKQAWPITSARILSRHLDRREGPR